MELPVIIISLGLLTFGAYSFSALFSRTKIPNALILLIVGIIIGPILGLVQPHHFGSIGPIFTTITLIILLFESGTGLKIRELMNSIGSALFLTIFNFIFSAVIATGVAFYATSDLDLLSAAFFGVIVAGTSSAIVIPMIKQLKINKKGETILLLESALSDVLCLVIGLALLVSMQEGVFEFNRVLDTVWKSFLFAGLIGFFGGLLWSILLGTMRRMENYTFSNLAFVFIIYGVSEYFHFNGGIATLVFGITLANAYLFNKSGSEGAWRPQELLVVEKNFFSELVFILSTYFFVYVGVCIKFSNITLYALALLIVIAIILIRPISIKFFVRSKMSFKDLSIMGIMIPKGLIPAILASIPLQYGFAGGETIQGMAYAVVLLSILICSILVILLSNDPLAIGYFRKLLLGKSEDSEKIIAETEAQEIAEDDADQMPTDQTEKDNGE